MLNPLNYDLKILDTNRTMDEKDMTKKTKYFRNYKLKSIANKKPNIKKIDLSQKFTKLKLKSNRRLKLRFPTSVGNKVSFKIKMLLKFLPCKLTKIYLL